VTDVISKAKCLAFVLLALSSLAAAQAKTPSGGPAESLYLRLRSVGLDQSHVYRIRHTDLVRGSVRISLDDGTIAFTEEAGGHITGALFQGDGEILVLPPNTVERASLALFTGAAILEERFSLAYFRFNDDLYSDLKNSLRDTNEGGGFADEFTGLAVSLAESDALRLLISFRNADKTKSDDHFLHAYIEGQRLGTFEVRYDSLLPEPISLGQHKKVGNTDYYDVWASFAQNKHPEEERDPDTGLLSTQDFEITQFKITSEITPPTELSSTAALSLSPKRSGGRLLLFELSRLLQVQSVEENGNPVEFIHNQAVEGSHLARRGNDWLVVFLPAAMEVAVPIQLKIRYSGSVISEAANGLLYVGERGNWYPNIGFTMSSFDMEFRYPLEWTLVAVGKRTEQRTEADRQISHWVTERKVPVAGFNLGKYSRTVAHVAGIELETYATPSVEKGLLAEETEPLPLPPSIRGPQPLPPALLSRTIAPSPSRNLQMVSNEASKALEFYSQNFGPYPYSRLMLTQIPGSTSQGWPGLIFLSSYAFLNPSELEQLEHNPVERLEIQQLIAHETAHQWWGDLVTFTGYRDQWVMEALANYSSMMLLESKNPLQFRKLMQKYRDQLLLKGTQDEPLMDAGPVTLGLRLSSSKFPNAYEAISYGRGTWMFHMLRTMLRDAEPASSRQRTKASDELFLRALRELRKQYEGRPVTTTQLLAVFEAQLPKPLWYEGRKSLDWFFDSWLSGTAVPSFELHDVKITEKAGAAWVTGTIIQDDAPESLVTSIPVYAVVGSKPVFLRRVFADGKDTSFRFSAPAGTRKILLDPEQTLLSRAK
jgi:hypothetical protein